MKKMKSLDISHSPMQLPVPKRSLAKNSSSSSQVKLQPSKRILDLNSRKNSDLHSKKEKVEVCQSREASCAKRTPPERAVESPQNRRQARPTRLVRESLSPGQSSASEAPLPYQNFSAKDMKRKGGSRRRRFLGARNGGPGGAMGLWASPVTKDPNRRFRSSKKSLVVHSVNSTHKKSRNTLTENYLSSQFNVSSRPGSNEQVSFVVSSHKKQFSNFSVPQELRKAQRPRRPNEPALSQKFLEVPCRGEYSMAKQKRVKSQVQMQTDKDKLNFTSINRIERDARESRRQHSRYYPVQTGSRQSQSIHSYEEEPSSPSKRDADSDFSRTNTSPEDCRVKRFAYEPSFAGAETVLEELEADEGTREANEEDFFYEQLGNIYCKRVEDYCADCRLVLQQIRRKCESCDASGGGISSKEAAAPSEADAEDDCSDTCLNCWNALASFAENCPQCGDETGTRSRNITFGNQIMIRKRSSANQIGETLVDFDERFKAGLLGAGRGPESGKGDRGKRAPDAIMRSPLLPKKAFAREGLKGRRQKEPERVRTSDAKRDLCIHIPGEGFSAGDSAREKKNKFKWVAEPRNQSYHTHSNSGEHHLAEHFDLRDPYLIRSRPEDVPALRDPGLPEIRKKAISNTLPQRRSRKKHFENSEAKKGRLGKKISILKSKKNSIKRADVFKKKHRGQGGGRKKKHICLDMSQNPSKLRHLEAEPVALKSCSMKNTVTKFRFDNPVQMRNFELRPKFRQAETAANDSRREQSINLIYKGKARLRRNHTTKLLRNISCHRDNHLELNYGQKGRGRRGTKPRHAAHLRKEKQADAGERPAEPNPEQEKAGQQAAQAGARPGT